VFDFFFFALNAFFLLAVFLKYVEYYVDIQFREMEISNSLIGFFKSRTEKDIINILLGLSYFKYHISSSISGK